MFFTLKPRTRTLQQLFSRSSSTIAAVLPPGLSKDYIFIWYEYPSLARIAMQQGNTIQQDAAATYRPATSTTTMT